MAVASIQKPVKHGNAQAVRQQISGWGRFPVETAFVYRPEKRSEIEAILGSGQQSTYISRGLGRSYGDAALNNDAGVISHLRLDRFLSFDPGSGELECEAGATLADILEFAIPRSFFLPVTPGTKFVTLGGALASDVHGKNHHQDGTIANFVSRFTLLTPTGDLLECSLRENPEVFWATMGGMGLTGAILKATIGLRAIETAYVAVDYLKARDLDQALEAFGSSDRDYQYSVAWIDCLASGKSLGRSVLMRGNHARRSQVPGGREPLNTGKVRQVTVPFDLPSFALNSLSIRAFNALYYAKHRNLNGQLVRFEPFFWPLDSILEWNRMYGKRGFTQYQIAVPLERGREALIEVLERLVKSRRASFLAVVKRFGAANAGLLSFPMPGYTLSLDIPAASGLAEFLHGLDEVVLRYGGRIYLAKDATMEAASFARMYPRAAEFRALKKRLDPEGLLSSSQARRLGLV